MLLDEGARWLAGPHIGVVWPSGAAVIAGMPLAAQAAKTMRRVSTAKKSRLST